MTGVRDNVPMGERRIKQAVADSLVPLGRFYIRHCPCTLFKSYLWSRLAWRPRRFLTRTRYGALIAGNSRDLIQGFVYYFGFWEPNLTAFIGTRLSGLEGRTFVDVGANIGYFSLLAAIRMPAGHVVAIEPSPSIYGKLVHNVRLNGFTNIRTVSSAATESNSEIELFAAADGNEGATTSIPGRFNSRPIRVGGKPLSELLTETEVSSIKMIKIDVEGAEWSVIRGMRSMLRKLRHDAELVVEITPQFLDHGKVREIFEILESAGYFAYALDNPYEASSYLFFTSATRPQRLRVHPSSQTDVVFSRIDADSL